MLGVPRHPEAILFQQSVYQPLVARVCGRCGYTELFVRNPEHLWDAYQQAAPKLPPTPHPRRWRVARVNSQRIRHRRNTSDRD